MADKDEVDRLARECREDASRINAEFWRVNVGDYARRCTRPLCLSAGSGWSAEIPVGELAALARVIANLSAIAGQLESARAARVSDKTAPCTRCGSTTNDRVDLPPGALEWLRTGERGISSEAIFSHLTGLKLNNRSRPRPPSDPGDLRRCRLLLDVVPAFRVELPRMAEVNQEWARLVEHWSELCALMDIEAPEWRDGFGKCPKTYERMRAALAGGR